MSANRTLPDAQQSREQSSSSKAANESAKLFGEDIASEYNLSKFAAAVKKAGQLCARISLSGRSMPSGPDLSIQPWS